MWVGVIDVDANGLVMFDPSVVAVWRPTLKPGDDLFTEMITSSTGDEVMKKGIFVPVLAIDDGGYTVNVRSSKHDRFKDSEIVATNGVYPLEVMHGLIVADLAVLRDWREGLAWTHVPMAAGFYAVTISAFRRFAEGERSLVDAGYNFDLDRRPTLPVLTADTGRGMRVLNWWEG